MTTDPTTRALGKHGVVYLATTTHRYLNFAMCSIVSLRTAGYTGPITLITSLDAPFLNRLDDLGVMVDRQPEPPGGRYGSRSLKTRLGSMSPYKRTLYLDCDTIVTSWNDDLWTVVDDIPIALARDLRATLGEVTHGIPEEKVATIALLGESTPHYNSGVMLWVTCLTTADLFAEWHAQWIRFSSVDQLPLIRALSRHSLCPVELPGTINVPFQKSILPNGSFDQSVRIFHPYGRDYYNLVCTYFPSIAQRAQAIINPAQ